MSNTRRRSGAGVTMQAVALRAGVSPMSVSNVLNGRGASSRVREAVMQAVDALDYTPNRAARQLASASTLTLGVLHGDIAHSFFSELMVGLLNAANRLGAQIVLQYAPIDDIDAALEALDTLCGRGVGGVILPPLLAEALSARSELARFGVPMLGVSPRRELRTISCVLTDDLAAAREITTLLIARGHRRIGLMANHEGARRDGYSEALRLHGIETDPALVVEAGTTVGQATDAANRLLNLPARPTAIFANNDDLAAGALAIAHMRGLRIPHDLAVAGFDDSSIAARVWPPITSVRRPVGAMAAMAVGQLVRQIRDREKGDAAIVALYARHEIILRASTGD